MFGEKNGVWTYGERDAELPDFGKVEVDWTNGGDKEGFDADAKLASVLGWSRVLDGDHSRPLELVGLVRSSVGKLLAVFAFVRSLSIGHDYMYMAAQELNESQEAGLRQWVESRVSASRQLEERQARRNQLLLENGLDSESVEARRREHGLDDESICQRRGELLRKHGLT